MKHGMLAVTLLNVAALFCWAGFAPPASAAADDSAVAKLRLADKYRLGEGVPKDEARATALTHEAAERGISRAQAALGWMYLEGDGVARDIPAALQWYEAAASQGNAYALFELGLLYRYGREVPKDEARGWRYEDRAAELQYPPAMTTVAVRLLRGPQEQRSPVRAMHYLIAAIDADAGHLRAGYVLGRQYYRGGTTGRVSDRALQALQRASEKKSVTAQMWLAQVYARGRGIAADSKRAEQLFHTVQAALSPYWTNEFAWELAITPEANLRDASRAIALMKTLVANPKEATARHLDTLAAAYAAGGQFSDAVTTQMLAIQRLGADAGRGAMVDGMKSRLALYRSDRAYTEQQP
jgi:TPR repeat protein